MFRLWTVIGIFLILATSGCQKGSAQNQAVLVAFPIKENFKQTASDQSTGLLDESFAIRGKNQSGRFKSKLENGQWKIGGIVLESWPIDKFFCHECDTFLKRIHRPDGPTVKLVVKNEGGKTLYISSSYQTHFSTGNWRHKHEGENVRLIELDSELESVVDSTVRSSIQLESKHSCSLLWSSKHYLAQPGVGISNDVAKFRSQFIIQCSN